MRDSKPFIFCIFVALCWQCGDGLPMLKSHVINTAVSKYTLTETGDKLYYLRQYHPSDSTGMSDMLLLINEFYEYDCQHDSSYLLVKYEMPYDYQNPFKNPFDSLLWQYRPQISQVLKRFDRSVLKSQEKGWQFDDSVHQLSITHTLKNCINSSLVGVPHDVCTKEYYIKFRGSSTTLSSREAEYIEFPSSPRWVTANNRLILNYYNRLWWWE